MPWQEVNKMSLKKEFVILAQNQNVINFSDLCGNYGISRTMGYKLLRQYRKEGENSFEEKSKRPKNSPNKTTNELEEKILKVRDKYYSWGGRKIYHYLKNKGEKIIPHPNTITDILRRHGRLYEWCTKEPKKPYQRFVRAKANDLWQMDFKGHFPLMSGRCNPLTILDDHSRFAIALIACADQTKKTVQNHMVEVFRRYGLPLQINTDNGVPWGTCGTGTYSELAIWLMRLGIHISYSKPGHPQTNGKDERFHRSLKQEVINHHTMNTLDESQKQFDEWRNIYNTERPHEAINYEVPAERYEISRRNYPEIMATIEYLDDDVVKKVNKDNACISFKNKQIFIGYAFKGQSVAIRATEVDGVYNIFYCQQKIKSIDLGESHSKNF